MGEQWPAPLPLAGVKSKQRAVWELNDVVLNVNDEACKIASVSLALGSRVAAIGSVGSALAAVILGSQKLSSGSAICHDDLTVLHVGPHLADSDAIVDALKARPHVVVLSDSADDENWTSIFREVVKSNELLTFQGAVIICAASEESIPQELCTMRWAATGGCFRAQRLFPGISMLDDICSKAVSDPSYNSLLAQISELAAANFKDTAEDAENPDISAICLAHGWTVAALTIPADPSSSSTHELVGYLTYNVEPKLSAICLHRVAVVPKFCRCGHAQSLVRWTIARAREQSFDEVLVHAVPALQTINKAIGFIYIDPADEIRPEEEKKKRSAWMMFSTEEKKVEQVKLSKKQRRKAHSKAR